MSLCFFKPGFAGLGIAKRFFYLTGLFYTDTIEIAPICHKVSRGLFGGKVSRRYRRYRRFSRITMEIIKIKRIFGKGLADYTDYTDSHPDGILLDFHPDGYLCNLCNL